MSGPAVLYAAADGVATLTMNRPQVLNALNDDLLNGLRDGFARAKADAAVRAVLLTGAGMSLALVCARRLARTPTRAYDLIQPALQQCAGNGFGTQLEVQGRLQAEAMATEDHKEGVAAFLAKPPAAFKGR